MRTSVSHLSLDVTAVNTVVELSISFTICLKRLHSWKLNCLDWSSALPICLCCGLCYYQQDREMTWSMSESLTYNLHLRTCSSFHLWGDILFGIHLQILQWGPIGMSSIWYRLNSAERLGFHGFLEDSGVHILEFSPGQ